MNYAVKVRNLLAFSPIVGEARERERDLRENFS